MAAPEFPYAPMPPIVCAPWCTDGDGHPHVTGRGDQTCWGPAAYIEPSLEDVCLEGKQQCLSRVGVMAYRGFNHYPAVYLHLDLVAVPGRPYTDRNLLLTTAEARTLAANLTRSADLIEGVAQ